MSGSPASYLSCETRTDLAVASSARSVIAAEVRGSFSASGVYVSGYETWGVSEMDYRVPKYWKNGEEIALGDPEGSYELIKGDDKLVTIRITDPATFWSVSK